MHIARSPGGRVFLGAAICLRKPISAVVRVQFKSAKIKLFERTRTGYTERQ